MKETIWQQTIDQLTKQSVQAIALMENNQSQMHFFTEDQPYDIRSISKTVMTMLAGIVNNQDPRFNEETYIYPIIQDKIHIQKESNRRQFEKIQVKHLLTHTMGYDKVLLMRKDLKGIDPCDYLDLIVNSDLVHEPGDYYLYSNASFYMLSVVLQEYLQEDLLSFADRHLFKPLGILDYEWEHYGHYLAGATRLYLHIEDLLKLGQVLLHEGTYQKHRYFSKEWFALMTKKSSKTPYVDTPNRLFRRFAYGHGLWLAKENGIFFGHGTDGQTLIILPEEKTILASLSIQQDPHLLEAHLETIVQRIVSK